MFSFLKEKHDRKKTSIQNTSFVSGLRDTPDWDHTSRKSRSFVDVVGCQLRICGVSMDLGQGTRLAMNGLCVLRIGRSESFCDAEGRSTVREYLC